MQNRPTVSLEELSMSNMYSIDAIVRTLEKKGICTRDEILESLKEIKAEQAMKKHKNW